MKERRRRHLNKMVKFNFSFSLFVEGSIDMRGRLH